MNDAILAELQAELARFSDRQLRALLELTLREMEVRDLFSDRPSGRRHPPGELRPSPAVPGERKQDASNGDTLEP